MKLIDPSFQMIRRAMLLSAVVNVDLRIARDSTNQEHAKRYHDPDGFKSPFEEPRSETSRFRPPVLGDELEARDHFARLPCKYRNSNDAKCEEFCPRCLKLCSAMRIVMLRGRMSDSTMNHCATILEEFSFHFIVLMGALP